MCRASTRAVRWTAASLTLLLTLTGPMTASASEGDFRVNGAAQKLGISAGFGRWPDGLVAWAYNPDGAPTVFANDAYFLSLVEEVMDEVRGVAGVTFDYQGVSAANLTDLNDNVVVFGWADIGGAGGLAGPASSCTGSQLVALGYCQYVDGSFRLNNNPAGVTWDKGDTDITERHIKQIMLHELLHLLGLGHSDEYESIMFARPYTNLHHLRPDDVEGLLGLYGEPESAGPLFEFIPPALGSTTVDDSYISTDAAPFTPITSIDENESSGFLGLFINPENANESFRVVVVDPAGFYHTAKFESYPSNGQTQFYFQTAVAQTFPGPWTFYVIDASDQLVTSHTLQVNTSPTINQPPDSNLVLNATRGPAPLTVDMNLNIGGDPENDLVDASWHIPTMGETTVGPAGSNCAPCDEDFASGVSSKSVTFTNPGIYEIYVTVNDNWTRYATEAGPPPQGDGGPGFRTLYRKVIRVTTAADDVAAMSDVSGDGVPDYATFTDKVSGLPQVLYISGATGRGYAAQRFLNRLWTGEAITFVRDANGDGNDDDPGIAMLARNAAGTIIVEIRRISDGAVTGQIKFLNRLWDAIDLVSINDADANFNPGLGVLAQLRGGKMMVEVRRISDGSVVSLQKYLNTLWQPVALASLDRLSNPSLVGVLARLPSGKNLAEMRNASDGALHNQLSFLNRIWVGRDLTALTDATGQSAWAMLANNPNGGKNLVQVLNSGGTLVNNVTILNRFWEASRLAASGDINGNTFDELLAFARNTNDDSNRAIQVIDHSSEESIDVAKP